ncbi:MAG: transposase [Candidatus Accumulibacter sp.]|nr:transposase [Accumulibacter sp.]
MEFKEWAGPSAVAKKPGLVEQTLRNWVKAAEAGQLAGAGKAVTPDERELARRQTGNLRIECWDCGPQRATATKKRSFSLWRSKRRLKQQAKAARC